MGVVSNKIDRENLKPGDHIYSWSVAYAYSHHGIYVDEGNVIHFTRLEGQEIGTGTGLDHVIGSSLLQHPLDYPCPICGDQSKSDGVISSCIDCFLSGGDHLYRYEYGVERTVFLAKADGGTCTLVSFSSKLANSPEQVIHRAIDFLRKGFGDYDVMKNNSEDFALCCKTGQSGQAASFQAAASAGQSGQAASLLWQAASLLAAAASAGQSGQAAASAGQSGQKESLKAAASAGVVFSASLFLARSSPLGSAVTVAGLAAYGTYCAYRYINDIGVRADVEKVVLEEEY